MYLITGGSDRNGTFLQSTEILIDGDSSWNILQNGDLPNAYAYLQFSVFNLNNEITLIGAHKHINIFQI